MKLVSLNKVEIYMYTLHIKKMKFVEENISRFTSNIIKRETPYSPFMDIEDDSPGGRLRAARTAKQMYLVDLAAATGLWFPLLALDDFPKCLASQLLFLVVLRNCQN